MNIFIHLKIESLQKVNNLKGYGFVLYTKILDDPNVDGLLLSIPKLRDRAYIQIGSQSVGVLYRGGIKDLTIVLPNNKNTTLYIIVENMGRLNFGDETLDNKGILNGVMLGGKTLANWTACLTSNFIPNYQEPIKAKRPLKIFGKPFVDLIAKYKTPERLLTSNKIK